MTDEHATNTSPQLDEESFTRLLAAAYVMQEHQDRVKAKLPPTDFTLVISQIVETQHLIQTRKLESGAALDLIVGRLQKLSGAAGVAVGILEASSLAYRAGSGTASNLAGSVIDASASISASCLKTGEKLRCPVAEADSRLNPAFRRNLKAQSILAVPVYYEAKVAGSVELYFSEVNAFQESDVRASELMAGLVTEVLAQSREQKLKQELAAERASVLQALERIKPQLERLSSEQSALLKMPETSADPVVCKACGHPMPSDATSCGECGATKESGRYPGAQLQSKWAAMWERRQEAGLVDSVPEFRSPEEALPSVQPSVVRPANNGSNGNHVSAVSPASSTPTDESQAPTWNSAEEEPTVLKPEEIGLARGVDQEVVPYRSNQKAAPRTLLERAREWALEKYNDPILREKVEGLWQTRRGDVSLAIASGVVAVALVWGLWPRHQSSVNAAATPPQATPAPAQKKKVKPPEPELTPYEKILVGLGLAEPPPTPVYMGDPEIKVWVDLQNGLYYCPAAELYGKTAKGKYTTQGDAQQDAFEPAFRKPCD